MKIKKLFFIIGLFLITLFSVNSIDVKAGNDTDPRNNCRWNTQFNDCVISPGVICLDVYSDGFKCVFEGAVITPDPED